MTRALAAALIASLAAGCSSPTAPSPTTLVTISPGTALLTIGATEPFSAFAVGADGKGGSVQASWATDTPAVVTISPQGVAAAVSAGVATITASYQGQQATRAVRVIPSYAGSWAGRYRPTACSGSLPSFCAFTHAPGATTGVVAVFLTQLGDQVTGFIYLDGATIPVAGTIAVTGTLSLQGELNAQGATPPYVSVRIENWNSSLDSSSRMFAGQFTQLYADNTIGAGRQLSNRVESELFNVQPTGPP